MASSSNNAMRKGRKPTKMEKIENKKNLPVTFCKRRQGTFKKAHELTILTGAEVAVITFTPTGRVYSYGHPSVETVADNFLTGVSPPLTQTEQLYRRRCSEKVAETISKTEMTKRALDIEKIREKDLDKMLADSQIQHLGVAFGEESLPQIQEFLVALEREINTHENYRGVSGGASGLPLGPIDYMGVETGSGGGSGPRSYPVTGFAVGGDSSAGLNSYAFGGGSGIGSSKNAVFGNGGIVPSGYAFGETSGVGPNSSAFGGSGGVGSSTYALCGIGGSGPGGYTAGDSGYDFIGSGGMGHTGYGLGGYGSNDVWTNGTVMPCPFGLGFNGSGTGQGFFYGGGGESLIVGPSSLVGGSGGDGGSSNWQFYPMPGSVSGSGWQLNAGAQLVIGSGSFMGSGVGGGGGLPSMDVARSSGTGNDGGDTIARVFGGSTLPGAFGGGY